MIIEIKDLPEGSKIKTIECKIEFDDSGNVEAVSETVSEKEPERAPNIAPEMLNTEF